MGTSFTFDAFVSYRRSDGAAVAHWLRRELQGFRLPRAMREGGGRQLKIYLDTAYERGTSDFYEQSIRPALLASRYLLVIATPDAVRRSDGTEDWIDREVRDFSSGPNRGNVIAVRALGDFNGPLPADLKERFPNIEIVDLRGAGRFSFLNPARASRLASEKLKLIAPLLEIPPQQMPRLRQEEERQQQISLGRTAGVGLGVLSAVSALSVYALQSRNSATRALEDSMFATGRMVLMAESFKFSKDDPNGREKRLLINQGCDLIDKLGMGSSSEPQINELVACRLERANSHEQLGEHAAAEKQIEDAILVATARHEKTQRSDAALRLVEAHLALADYLRRQKDIGRAMSEYRRLATVARQLQVVHDKRSDFIASEAEADEQLGELYAAQEQRPKAIESFDAAGVAYDRALEWSADEKKEYAATSLMRVYRSSADLLIKDNAGPNAIFRLELARAVRAKLPVDVSPEFDEELAVTTALIYALEMKFGKPPNADTAHAAALEIIARVVTAAHATPELKAKAENLRSWMDKYPAAK